MRRRSLIVGIVVIGAVLIGLTFFFRDTVDQSLTPAQMREDLTFLRDSWAPLDKSFSAEQRQIFDSILDEVTARAGGLTPAAFAMEVSRAVATSGNGHTNASPYRYFSYLPIRVWWFLDGLYIIEAHPDYASLLGARIERIGELSADQALLSLAPFISGTREHQRFMSSFFLIGLEALYYAGVTQKVDEASLTIELSNHSMETIVLRKQPTSGPAPGGLGLLIPSPADLPGRWPHILDSASQRSPAFEAPAVDVAYQWMAGGSTLYIRSNRILSTDDQLLHEKLIDLLHEIPRDQRPRFAIVDLRLNTGGNLFNTVVFSQMLPAMIPPDGKIFVLVGNVTFSAAIVTAAMLKRNGGDKVLFVGERMGDSPQFWAEGREVLLPNSGIPVSPAGGFHDWTNGCAGTQDCYIAAEIFGGGGVLLEPDIEVPTRFSDYAVGRDVVLESALSMVD